MTEMTRTDDHQLDVEKRAQAPWSAWADRMAESSAVAVIEEVFPSRRNSPAFRVEITRFVRMNLAAMASTCGASAAGGRTDRTAMREFGKWLAEQGFSVRTVKDAYWVGLRQTLNNWAEAGWTGLVPEGPEDPEGLAGGGVSGELISAVTGAALDLTEAGAREATTAHDEATAVFRTSGETRRRDLVTEILDGRRVDHTGSLDTALGYRMAGTHLCVLVDAVGRERAEAALKKAQAATGASDRLLVPLAASRWAGWLGHSREMSAQALSRMRDALNGTGTWTAVGGPRKGVEGFRRAHDEALRVEKMRSVLAADRGCLCFQDLALESVLLNDVPGATAFAAAELRELTAATPRADRIRETLFAWLSSGSRVVAASELGVHENTVRLRLDAAADVLGHGYTDRRAELLTALRICRALRAERLYRAAVEDARRSPRRRDDSLAVRD
ncbi:hypothetical protein QR77_34730 [Streptomyces sp. 150FB]|uniref:PucR family transcriptional regulator n=1 Tax=Streptomyces sp. 150FB TaxID=1576605 RepID=UPI0005894BBA|nr:helix-turn-helix domain-containing protein [Streptomyces sp. 150FB]KIF77601.1 hypothetical protein QR77_34730 [Streptomyces sp. 150FB]